MTKGQSGDTGILTASLGGSQALPDHNALFCLCTMDARAAPLITARPTANSQRAAELSPAMPHTSSAYTTVGGDLGNLGVAASSLPAPTSHNSLQQRVRATTRCQPEGVESIDNHDAFDAAFGLQEHALQERRPPEVCITGSFLAAHNEVMDPQSFAPVDFECNNEPNEVLACLVCVRA